MNSRTGLANDTKWRELQTALAALGPQAPYWRTLALNGYLYPPSGWDADWTYHFRLGEYRQIDWCELLPRGAPGTLALAEISALCRAIGFEIEVQPDRVKILAYA